MTQPRILQFHLHLLPHGTARISKCKTILLCLISKRYVIFVIVVEKIWNQRLSKSRIPSITTLDSSIVCIMSSVAAVTFCGSSSSFAQRGFMIALFQYVVKAEVAKQQLHMKMRMGSTASDSISSICRKIASCQCFWHCFFYRCLYFCFGGGSKKKGMMYDRQ